MVAWKVGIRKKDGILYRQVPTRFSWSSTLWVSRSGACYRRYYNPFSNTWRFMRTPQKYILDEASGRIGLHIEQQWVPVTTVIALAWKHNRAPGSAKKTILKDGKSPIARHIQWEKSSTNQTQKDMKDEVWSALNHRVGIFNCPTNFQISSRGRLMSPSGVKTAGFYFNDSFVASCGDVMVDLLVASKLKPPYIHVSPHLSRAADCLLAGGSPHTLSKDVGLSLQTAHTYFTQVAGMMHASDLHRVVPNLIPRDVWSALHKLHRQRDDRLGGSLSELLPAVETLMRKKSSFHKNEYKWAILRLGRMCVVSYCSSLKLC